VLAGIVLKPEGIEFNPMTPTGMEGKKHIRGLKYRQAELDITIEGSGNDIARITDNGKAMESAFLPNDITGKHKIVIELRHSHRGTQSVTVHRNEALLPATPDVTWNGDSGFITDYQQGNKYVLLMNDHQSSLSDSAFAAPNEDGAVQVAVAQASKYGYGYMSRPLLQLSLTPQMALIADSAYTSVTVTVSQGGDYLLDVGYEPTGSLDVRELRVNSHIMGTLVMARVAAPADGVCYSNMVGVKLLKGDNQIELTQLRLPKSFTPCRPRHVRIIKK